MPSIRPFAACAVSLAVVSASLAQNYVVVIDQSVSGLVGSVSFTADTSGTLVGNWDPDTNPDGTRTKPGLWGSFGATENVPVPVQMGLELAGPLDTETAGGFGLQLDTDGATLMVEGFSADFLADGPASIPATMSFYPESFRTRNPDSTYIGIPIELPLGDLSITSMVVAQTEDTAVGVLTETAPGEYDFAVVIPAVLNAEFELLGTPYPVEGLPFAVTLAGTISVSGDSVAVSAAQTIEFEDAQEPGLDLPELPLDLPTVLPPGYTAHLLLNLTLDTVSSALDGTFTFSASGVQAACPADFNGDTVVNTLDFVAFLNAFVAQDGSADFNGDTVVNTIDFVAFLNAFVAGC
ncbi:MAG: hypothetical protein KJZ54_09380 [Phycisphaerales bacterium]|nr:hypothetical protein [Phycisphaerales bacterium]